MAHYLVTGGAGFIGSHLIEALVGRGDEVRVLDDLSTGRRDNLPPSVPLTIGDVADAAVVREAMAGVDGCFHLAAVASVERGNEDWLGTHRANLTGTIAVLDAARAAKTPVVYASSAAVYGDNPAPGLTETAPPAPLSAYGADKLGCELHAAVAFQVHGVPTTGFRFFNVYGPRQDPGSPYSGVIAIFAGQLTRGEPISIFGDGQQVRDFIYVTDVVAHLLAAIDRTPARHEVYNVCTGRETSVRHLAQVIAGLKGTAPVITHAPERAGDIRRSLGDPAKAVAAFGLRAQTPLEDGLRLTLDWMAAGG
jgi:UDP-glucose 4-epimerase